MNDDTTRRVIPIVAAVIVVAALVYTLLPFKVAGAIECGPALFGSDPRSTTSVGLLRPATACDKDGSTRLVNAAIVGFLALVGGASALLYPYIAERSRRE